MYSLPLKDAAATNVPLHEHTAFVVLTGLLHTDLDDRYDTIYGALEIDPLLAAWAVCVADQSGAKLKSSRLATRWISNSFLTSLPGPTPLPDHKPLTAREREAWRSISVRAIAAGRRALRIAGTFDDGEVSADAFWLAMLCSVKNQLEHFSKLNGKSPIHGVAISWPRWLKKLESEILGSESEDRNADSNKPASADEPAASGERRCSLNGIVCRALASAAEETISSEERELWFRPYPEFRQLFPLMLEKLTRLQALEENFTDTLQHEKLASMKQLAYGASHEINNPLANISTRAQSLASNEMDNERRKKLVAINDQAFRAYEMIADLMLFAKPPQLELRHVSLNQLIRQLCVELSDAAVAQGMKINLRLSEAPIDCNVDAVQLSVALRAICVNGFEAMQEGGQLTIETSLSGRKRFAEINIEDTGTGLTESAQRHLFDPFFSGREAGRGLGFGLSKAWRIVDTHRGNISVSSQPSRGTRFTITLPLVGTTSRQSQSRANTYEPGPNAVI